MARKRTKPTGYLAIESVAWTQPDGVLVSFAAGTAYPDLTAADIKGHSQYFTPLSPPTAPVEAATANPGEKRKTTRVAQ